MDKKKYIYSKLTIDNNSFVKRFSHKKRFQKALSLSYSFDNASVLDFGTGDGYFLNLIKTQKSKLNIVGYEPFKEMYLQLKNNIKDEEITIINNLNELSNKKFETIYCLEVLEHFHKKNQQKIVRQIKSKLKKEGQIVISVPIEVGLSSLIKNIIRLSINQVEKNTSYTNILRALCFRNVDRIEKEGYIFSHIGFNYKKLEKVFEEENLKVIKKRVFTF